MAKFVLTKNNNGITSFKKSTIPLFHCSMIEAKNSNPDLVNQLGKMAATL
jgi:hypothetical protein